MSPWTLLGSWLVCGASKRLGAARHDRGETSTATSGVGWLWPTARSSSGLPRAPPATRAVRHPSTWRGPRGVGCGALARSSRKLRATARRTHGASRKLPSRTSAGTAGRVVSGLPIGRWLGRRVQRSHAGLRNLARAASCSLTSALHFITIKASPSRWCLFFFLGE